jgi:hypothetical protein
MNIEVVIQYLVKFSYIKMFEDAFSDYRVVCVSMEGANANAPKNHGQPTIFYEFIDMYVPVFYAEPPKRISYTFELLSVHVKL